MELRVLTMRDRESITLLFREVFMNEPWNDDWRDEICHIFLQTDRSVPAYSFYGHRGFRELTDHVSFVKELTDHASVRNG